MTHASLTEASILADLRSARREWVNLIAQLDEEHLTEPDMAGYWSVKDVVGHLTAVDRCNLNALLIRSSFWPPISPLQPPAL